MTYPTQPAKLLTFSAVRYQQTVENMLKFWHMNGECKNCLHQSNIKQLIKQQMVINKVRQRAKN